MLKNIQIKLDINIQTNIIKMLQKIKEYNKLILEKLSIFLNETPNAIKKEMINDLVKNYDFTEEKAFAYLLSSFV